MNWWVFPPEAEVNGWQRYSRKENRHISRFYVCVANPAVKLSQFSRTGRWRAGWFTKALEGHFSVGSVTFVSDVYEEVEEAISWAEALITLYPPEHF
jgi:hypothetical protein